LKDGTLLLGPLKKRPESDLGPFVEVKFNDQTWFVVYCCKALSQEQTIAVRQWAEKQISSQAQ
jgi:hypothetical protein